MDARRFSRLASAFCCPPVAGGGIAARPGRGKRPRAWRAALGDFGSGPRLTGTHPTWGADARAGPRPAGKLFPPASPRGGAVPCPLSPRRPPGGRLTPAQPHTRFGAQGGLTVEPPSALHGSHHERGLSHGPRAAAVGSTPGKSPSAHGLLPGQHPAFAFRVPACRPRGRHCPAPGARL